jgi:predicted RNA polymerase sigma factor
VSDAPAAAAALERAFRDERAAVLATLTRHLGGDLGAAEDALQDALADAAREWPRSGAPARPGAWLTVAARRRALDRLRREKARPAGPRRSSTSCGSTRSTRTTPMRATRTTRTARSPTTVCA